MRRAGDQALEPQTTRPVRGKGAACIGNITALDGVTYIYAGSVMRRNGYAGDNGLFTMLGDHLGLTTAIVDAMGAVVASACIRPAMMLCLCVI